MPRPAPNDVHSSARNLVVIRRIYNSATSIERRPMTLQYRVPKTNLFAPSGNDTFAASDDSEPAVDWKKIRRARPLDELLPATQRWAAALPDAVRPVELLRAYPRIA